MDDRAKQFKTAAESQLTGPALKKEINTLRRFLFRNQEYRFTKAAQQALYMAVLAHYGNAAAHHASGYPATATSGSATTTSTTAAGSAGSGAAALGSAADSDSNTYIEESRDDDEDDDRSATAAEAPILRLLDDALKMPFTVFTSPQKDKLLGLYWAVLGTDGAPGAGRDISGGAGAAAVLTHRLSLMDIVDAGKNKALLSLFTNDGEEYAQEVLVSDAATLKQLKKEFDEGNVVVVTVQETDTGASFISFTVEEED